MLSLNNSISVQNSTICTNKLSEIKIYNPFPQLSTQSPPARHLTTLPEAPGHYLEQLTTSILNFRPQMHKIFRIFHMKFDCLFIAAPLSCSISPGIMDRNSGQVPWTIAGWAGRMGSRFYIKFVIKSICLPQLTSTFSRRMLEMVTKFQLKQDISRYFIASKTRSEWRKPNSSSISVYNPPCNVITHLPGY